jgi:hypothetical protein
MGVLAHRLRTLDRSLVPSSTRAEVFRFPFFEISPVSAQKLHSMGGREGPRILFGVGILIFVLLRSPCKIAKPYDNPFWGN